MAGAYIGTSGWNYKGWKAGFYEGAPQREWLAFCAERFTGVEINGTHYRLQSPETFRRWKNETPARFRFTMKGHRYVTHNKKLKDALEPIRLERERAAAMGSKLKAVVWQLPRSFHKDIGRLDSFGRALGHWRAVRHAVEFRNPSWFDEEVAGCLSRHRLAACQSDAADWPLWDVVTTDLVYIRLHGSDHTYASAYSESQLDQWAAKCRRWLGEGREVHVYFDNDSQGHAPFDAMKLLARLK